MCGPERSPASDREASAHFYRPKHRPPATLEAILQDLAPGHDAFPEEKEAEELAGRLKEMGAFLRERPGHAADAAVLFLTTDFKGGRLVSASETTVAANPALQIFRGRDLPGDLVRDRRSFGDELRALVDEFRALSVTEFLITAIEVTRKGDLQARTTVRYDLVGAGKKSWRAERLGRWQMSWRHEAGGTWRISEWTSLEDRRSQASDPIFTEVTETALGGDPAFDRQLRPGLDHWLTRLDAAFLVGGMGHHGVSVGDYDGDGFEDLYVANPSGLPGRLFRNRGDGTFEDKTEAAGLLVLDATSQSLFADVDNDGDQDLILVTRSGPLLFVNDGKGHFTRDEGAFRLKERLRGTLTSATMADYDRDGFLDLYLCAYSFFIGASEDKAGPPTPYHDAENGPPNILLRNDGHGHFVDVTSEAGLDNNDRFSFAASFGDYDEDGWPDLLVANDFGRKNLYHNEAKPGGGRTFRDVAAAAGVEDHGAGMSAAFLDYDNDGHLDIYTGNMWTATGLRVTAEPGFKPDAPPEIRALYKRHARGNSLFRNRGDGTFEDVTLRAGVQMGRWAWASDAFDFDRDGFLDLFVVNGMFTRDSAEQDVDVDGFFWRQVTALSPLTRKTGTSYDDAWRATNRLLVTHGSQASHERKVLLRNDGLGGFDEVAGSVGLDLDQDGRSFAVFDYDQDGDPDLVLMAPRSSPELRLFRNDFKEPNAGLAVRLVGTKSNRDAVGARVTVETDTLRLTRVVQAGSGFISQHSKELLFGLGRSGSIRKLTVLWPSGQIQTFSDLSPNERVRIEEGSSDVRREPFRKSADSAPARAAPARGPTPASATGIWLYQPFPAPDFTLRDQDGGEHSLKGARPALLFFWSTAAPASRAALERVARERKVLADVGVSLLALSVDPPGDQARVRAAVQGLGVPSLLASDEMAGTYALLYRYLFDRKEDLPLPTALLVGTSGDVVKVYRDGFTAAEVAEDVRVIDVPAAERLRRAVPFAGTFYASPGERNYFQYGLELAEQGYDRPSLVAFERVATVDPSAITFYNLGTLYMKGAQPSRARAAFERALDLQPEYPEAANSLGALLAQGGDVPGAIGHFRTALASRPEFADALNNLGFALFQTGQREEAFDLYEKALKQRPDFPEALNNLGIFYGQKRDLERAESYFRQAVEIRPSYGEAGNNLALVLNARGDVAGAVTVLQRAIHENPGFEMLYVTLSRIYLATGHRAEGVAALEQLLQRNPANPLGLQMLRQVRAEP